MHGIMHDDNRGTNMSISSKLKTTIFASCCVVTVGLSSSLQAAPKVLQINQKVPATSDYAKTNYPILMVHGWLGWSKIGTNTIGMDYWYQILPDLARNGANVFAAQLSPAHQTEFRGEQLIRQVEEVLAITGAEKVNLIGHSHGGPTSQYVAVTYPDKVASVTGLSGTFHGSKVADDIQGNKLSKTGFNIVGNYLVAPLISWGQGQFSMPYDFDKSMKSLTEKESVEFNKRFPTNTLTTLADCKGGEHVDSATGIPYYSWTGVAQATNALDIDTILMQLGPLSYKHKDNDGMVARCSSLAGQVIRDNYKLNHTDVANMMFGLTGKNAPDPIQLIREHANRLKQANL